MTIEETNFEKTAEVDRLIESKIKRILGEGPIINPDLEMNMEVFEFQGCHHENITPRDYSKRCNNLTKHFQWLDQTLHLLKVMNSLWISFKKEQFYV